MSEEGKKEWYVVNTYAGHENAVKENLVRRVETMGLQDNLFRIVVAEETYVETKGKKTVEKTRNLFPGYLFVEMIMTDEAWYVVRNTPGVTGFIGSSGGGAKPFPVNEQEVEAVLRKMGMHNKEPEMNYNVGDRVKVLSGPFANMEGTVETIDTEAKTVSILVIIFGRETPTTLDCADVEKIEEY